MRSFLKTFHSNNRGVVAVYFAVLAPLLLIIAALGTEATYWMLEKRQLQKIADTSAYAAAVRWNRTGSKDAAAEAAGLTLERAGMPLSELAVELAFDDLNKTVSMAIGRNVPRYLTRIFDESSVNINARAVASFEAVSGDPVCVTALSTNERAAISVKGSARVSFDGCLIHTNSSADDSIDIQGNGGSLEVGCVYTAGAIDQQTINQLELPLDGDCSEVKMGAGTINDNYADLNFPARADYLNFAAGISTIDESTCGTDTRQGKNSANYRPKNHKDNQGGQNNGNDSDNDGCDEKEATNYLPDTFAGLRAGYFPDGLNLSGNISLEPGIYIVGKGRGNQKGLSFSSNATVTGNGVLFVLVDGAELSLNANNIDVDLTAPSTGPLGGMLFASTEGEAIYKITGGSLRFSGVFYFPTGDIEMSGSGAVANPSCMQIVANTITFTGNSDIESSCPEGAPTGGRVVTLNSGGVAYLSE